MSGKTWKAVWSDYKGADLSYERKALEEAGIDFHPYQLLGVSEEEAVKKLADADMIMVNMYPLKRGIIEKLEQCKFIMRHGVGYDSVDVAACTERNIVFANIPDVNTLTVAEHTLAMILMCGRKMRLFDSIMHAGRWEWKDAVPIFEVSGKTLGVFGCGRIGSRLVRLLEPFGMRVLVNDPYIDREKTERELGVKMVNLDTLLAASDFITLHTPLTEETYHRFGENEFKKMKKSAYIINAARGPVIEQHSLIRALKEKRIAGAALDVFEHEPPIDIPEIAGMENLVMTPHVGGYSEEVITNMQKRIAADMIKFSRGKRPGSVINPEVWERLYGGK